MKNAATKMGQSLNIRRAARKRRIVGSGANGTSPSHRLHGETGAAATCSKPAWSVNGADASRRNDYDLSKDCFRAPHPIVNGFRNPSGGLNDQ